MPRKDRAMGFCYLSNIAIAALEALAQGRKVAIYDLMCIMERNGGHLAESVDSILFLDPPASLLSGTGTKDVGKNCF